MGKRQRVGAVGERFGGIVVSLEEDAIDTRSYPRAGELLSQGREALRGREILLLIPLFFLVVLLIVIVLDMQERPQLQPLQPAPPRLQVIDGQKKDR